MRKIARYSPVWWLRASGSIHLTGGVESTKEPMGMEMISLFPKTATESSSLLCMISTAITPRQEYYHHPRKFSTTNKGCIRCQIRLCLVCVGWKAVELITGAELEQKVHLPIVPPQGRRSNKDLQHHSC